MALPPEIIEKILIKCDGKTLVAARRVCKQWSELVEYLSKVSPSVVFMTMQRFFFVWCRKLHCGIGVVARKSPQKN
jgi:hypothetical protein